MRRNRCKEVLLRKKSFVNYFSWSLALCAVVLTSAFLMPKGAAATDWKATLQNNYARAKSLAGRDSFNGYCSMAVSYELLAYGITTSQEPLGNGHDAARHFSGGGTTSGGYAISYTAGSTSAGWGPADTAMANGNQNGIYIISYTSNSSPAYGHVSFLVIEGGTVYLAESYAYSGNPEGTGMAFSYASYKSQWSRYYPNVTGVVRFDKSSNQLPLGKITSATSPEPGKISIKGWCYDPDSPNQSMGVTCWVEGPEGGNGQYCVGMHTNASSHEFSATFDTAKRGNTYVICLGVDIQTGEAPQIGNSGTRVRVSDPKGDAITSIRDGRYVLHTATNPSNALAIVSNSMENHGTTCVWPCNGTPNKQYDIKKNEDGSYTIFSVLSGKCLEYYSADNGYQASGSPVTQYTSNETYAQQWWIEANDDGTYSFRNKDAGLYMDKAGGMDHLDEGGVILWRSLGNLAQKWYLVPISYKDVNDNTDHQEDITYTTNAGVSFGWCSSDGSSAFRPYNNVARADMAAFLFRLAVKQGKARMDWEATDAQKSAFTDVNADTPHAREIWWLASTGISEGWTVNGKKEFRPYATVARQDMAAFLFRLAKLTGKGNASDSWQASALSKTKFRDVSATAPDNHHNEVWWLAETGVSTGWDTGGGQYEFRGLQDVARCDMAAFLHRLDTL